MYNRNRQTWELRHSTADAKHWDTRGLNARANEINDRHLELMITKTDYQNNRTWTGTKKKTNKEGTLGAKNTNRF